MSASSPTASTRARVGTRASVLIGLALLAAGLLLNLVAPGDPQRGLRYLVSLEAIATIGVSVVLLMVPGSLIVSLLRLDRIAPITLMPAAAITSSVFILIPLVIVQLSNAWNIWALIAMYAAVTALLGLLLVRRRARSGAPIGITATVVDAGSWVRSGWGALVSNMHPITRYATLAAAVLGYVIGTLIAGDALYHTAQALKLAELAQPDFNNTLQFPDGTSHPGYQVPVWQAMLSMIASIAQVHPATAMWLLPVLLTPIAVLTAAGAVELLLGSRVIGGFAALAWIAVNIIQSLPYSYGIRQAPYPRQVVTDLAIPLVIVAFAVAVTSLRRSARARALVLMVIAQVIVVVVHVSYVFLVGMMVAGYLLVWAISAAVERWPQWREHLAAGSTLALTTGIGIAALTPYLADLHAFTGDATSSINGATTPIDAPAGTQLGVLLVGTAEQFHLRADYLVWLGGFSLLGLFATATFVLVRTSFAGRLFLGTTGVVLVVALSNHIYPHLVHAVGAGQAKRVWLLVPAVPALAFALFLLSVQLERLWNSGKRLAACMLWVAVAAGVLVVAARYPIMSSPLRPLVSSAPIKLFAAVLLLAGAAGLLAAGIRLVRGRPMRRGIPIVHPGAMAVGSGAAIALACAVIVGATPRYYDLAKAVRSGTMYRPADIVSYSSFRRGINPFLVTYLAQQPTGTVILAQPDTAYGALAVAPIYVASSDPGHTANTPGNRIEKRYADVTAFYAPGTSDARRMNIIRRYKAKLVIAGSRDWSTRMFLRRYPDVFTQQTYGRVRAWSVNTTRLATTVPADRTAGSTALSSARAGTSGTLTNP